MTDDTQRFIKATIIVASVLSVIATGLFLKRLHDLDINLPDYYSRIDRKSGKVNLIIGLPYSNRPYQFKMKWMTYSQWTEYTEKFPVRQKLKPASSLFASYKSMLTLDCWGNRTYIRVSGHRRTVSKWYTSNWNVKTDASAPQCGLGHIFNSDNNRYISPATICDCTDENGYYMIGAPILKVSTSMTIDTSPTMKEGEAGFCYIIEELSASTRISTEPQ